MIVNADELKLFRTIYETESLSEAAARLQLSLSKASRQLASLRKTFGDKLFVRCDHRMCPTLRALAPAQSGRASERLRGA